MVVLRRLLLVLLLGLLGLPLRPGTTAAYLSRSFDRDAARKCPQLIRNANLLWLHPFILLGRAILRTLPDAGKVDAYCHDGDLGKPRAERASGL